jgi:hypothetical protein
MTTKAELEDALRERDQRIAGLKGQMGQLLEIIQANPGLTPVEIHHALAKRSWAARRFGKWAAMLGPTYGATYVALAQLSRDGSVHVNRDEATAEWRKGRRPTLRFYAADPRD